MRMTDLQGSMTSAQWRPRRAPVYFRVSSLGNLGEGLADAVLDRPGRVGTELLRGGGEFPDLFGHRIEPGAGVGGAKLDRLGQLRDAESA
jgi:hypothetical protein